MREITYDGHRMKVVLDAEMSKYSPEQRQAMASLNQEAVKRLAERVQFDEEKEMTQKNEIATPFKDAFGTEICDKGIEPDSQEQPGARITTNSLRYTQETLATEFHRIFCDEIMLLRDAGQKEYAHDDSSPFANFERGAKDMGIDRKQVLWVYAMKHKDGIAAHLKGTVSQREDVRGRINDLIVYLLLLRGILNEEAGNTGNFGLGKLG